MHTSGRAGATFAMLSLALAACSHTPARQVATPVTAQPQAASPAAPDVSDLLGARASSAERAMETRGLTVARQRGLTAYWLDAAERSCVRTVTADGRLRTVEMVATAACRR